MRNNHFSHSRKISQIFMNLRLVESMCRANPWIAQDPIKLQYYKWGKEQNMFRAGRRQYDLIGQTRWSCRRSSQDIGIQQDSHLRLARTNVSHCLVDGRICLFSAYSQRGRPAGGL